MKYFWNGFEKRANSFEDSVVEANLESSKPHHDVNKVRAAERELVRNQKDKIKHDTGTGAMVGTGLGVLTGLAKEKSLLGGAIGGLIGATSGAATGYGVGAIRGSRGSDAAKIRKKHFGTDDLDVIKKRYFTKEK
jgi:hypothetical protein